MRKSRRRGEDSEPQSKCVTAEGRLGRENELLVVAVEDSPSNVLFFPGDVQAFHASMVSGPFAEYTAFAYETVATMLSQKFGQANVWVVVPSRFTQSTYSCFDHFVPSNDHGAATEYPHDGEAIEHTTLLMHDAQRQLEEQGDAGVVMLDLELPLHLVGFSKGVVVLNQLVAELAACSDKAARSQTADEPADGPVESAFFEKIKSIHWVDGGNGSLEGSVPSNCDAIAKLADFSNMELVVHVTPYQFDSKSRPWIREEMMDFVSQLEATGANARIQHYYQEETGSIDTHFQLLNDFEVSISSPASSTKSRKLERLSDESTY